MLIDGLIRLACFAACFFAVRALLLLARAFLSRRRRSACCACGCAPLPCASSPPPSRPLRTLVVLGSGGHTAEMLSLLQTVERRVYAPLVYVRASTDRSSAARVQLAEEAARRSALATAASKEGERADSDTLWPDCIHVQIPRSREVGQSYVSSIGTTLHAALHALRIVLQQRPDVLLCNGPGTGVPLVVAAWLAELLLFRRCVLVFIESFCRVQSVSLSGRLLYPLVDRFVVQWPQLDAHASDEQAGEQPDGTAQGQTEHAKQKRRGWTAVEYIGRLL